LGSFPHHTVFNCARRWAIIFSIWIVVGIDNYSSRAKKVNIVGISSKNLQVDIGDVGQVKPTKTSAFHQAS
jgi:hypothetical protein